MSPLDPIAAPAFAHNLDTCVGCHACVIACANENGLAPGKSWRQIVSYNPSHVPGMPVYHLSLACNHCLDAPCVKGCPARAIMRDKQTGAVLIDDAECIGCRYCSWVCPYDAPQFNADRGVMEKCTFCNHRLEQDLQPACTSMCPTGALSFGKFTHEEPIAVPGFPVAPIRPAISFQPMKGRAPQPAPPGSNLPSDSEIAAWTLGAVGGPPASKITLKGEWTLAVFSFIGIALVAWFLAFLAGGWIISPEIFGLAGVTGLAMSTLHLGKKERAWRAILNLRSSWLSREVLTYPLFIGMGILSTVVCPDDTSLAWATAVVGALLLVAIDAVYAVMAREWSAQLDGQASVLSAAFLVSVMTGNVMLALISGALRLFSVADRIQKEKDRMRGNAGSFLLRSLRIGIGFIASGLLWIGAGEVNALVVACALFGEFADRMDFYHSLNITTPRRSMAQALTWKRPHASAT